jgi:hypothetical protein
LDDKIGRSAARPALPLKGATKARLPCLTPWHITTGFDLKTAEPLRVEVLALHGGPVTLTASIAAAVETIHLTPDEARRLGMLLARAAIAAGGRENGDRIRRLRRGGAGYPDLARRAGTVNECEFNPPSDQRAPLRAGLLRSDERPTIQGAIGRVARKTAPGTPRWDCIRGCGHQPDP